MNISNIKYGKSSASMLVDGVLYKNLSIDALVQEGIVEGTCTKEEFEKFLDTNELYNAKKYALSLLSRGSRTEQGCRKKMREKGYGDSSVKKTIEFLKEYGYIDDFAFAKLYVDVNKNNKGYYRLRYELKNKGVAESIINQVLSPDDIMDEVSILAVAERYMRNKEITEKTMERLYRHLLMKGYPYDLIKNVIGRYKS